jgi:hypothetical protein
MRKRWAPHVVLAGIVATCLVVVTPRTAECSECNLRQCAALIGSAGWVYSYCRGGVPPEGLPCQCPFSMGIPSYPIVYNACNQ